MKKNIENDKNLTIEQRVRRINATMAIEGLPLSEKDIDVLIKCISGQSTHEIERQKIIERCKKQNGRGKNI